jgi:hypothetical protein
MKYFTPELIVQGQAHDDAALNRHEEEWDQVCERYEAYLDTIRPHFPPGIRHIFDNYYLHDALIQGMGQQGRLFVIVLQLDTPPQSLLTFQYDLVEDPVILRDGLPAELRCTGTIVDWQYDEVEMVVGDPPAWRQSILLNNGWEVRLHFRDLRVQEVQALIPAPHPSIRASALSPSA